MKDKMSGYQIDPECPDLAELNDDFELSRQTAEYDPMPTLEEIEGTDCLD